MKNNDLTAQVEQPAPAGADADMMAMMGFGGFGGGVER